jgi:hypothetical protein
MHPSTSHGNREILRSARQTHGGLVRIGNPKGVRR